MLNFFFGLQRTARKRRVQSISGTARYEKHKEQTRALIHERLAHLNTSYGFTYGRVSIKNARTMWGSCSRKGNLNFNYRLLFLPQELRDYVIVHELCHLRELTHSKRFWELVSRTIPDYPQYRSHLKTYAISSL